MQSTEPPKRRLNTKFWGIFSIWLFTFLAYSNSFNSQFQFDDTHTVQMNLYVRSLKYIPQYFVDANTFSYRPENSGYRPMTTTALALGFALSQNETWGYHLIKVIEHCLVATLIVLIGMRVVPRPHAALIAILAALIFGVHRANTETVNYISAVSTLQAGLFHLLAFYLYLRWTESVRPRRRIALLALSVTSYLASMLSKEEGITLVAMIFFYEWIFRRQTGEGYWQRLRKNIWPWAKLLLPYIAVAILFVVLRTAIQPAAAEKSRGTIPTFIYFITQFRSWLHYWKLFFWPLELNADNLSFDFSRSLADWRVLASLAFHSAVWGLAWFYGRTRRFLLFAVLWLYITVLPASSIFPLVEAVNEHRMYVPYAFLSLLAVWLVFELATRLSAKWGVKVATGLVVVLALLNAVGTHARNEVWQTDLTLWEDIYEKNPDSPRAMNVLGVSLLNQGNVDRSVKLLERCHKIVPTYLPCIVHLGMGYAKLKKYKESLEILRYGHSVDAEYPHINFHLGVVYKEHFGDFANAHRHFETVVRVTDGRFFPATVKLAEMEMEQGHVKEGMALLNTVLQLDPSNGDAAEVHAKGLMLQGHYKPAAQILGQLVKVAPQDPRFLMSFANVHERAGYLKEARNFFGQAANQHPYAIQAWIAIVRVAGKLGEHETAKVAQEQVARLKTSGDYLFFSSLFLVGEKPRQTKPE